MIDVLFYLFFPGGTSGIARYTHEVLSRLDQLEDVRVELACPPSYFAQEAATYSVWPGLQELYHPVPWRRRLRFLTAQARNPFALLGRVRAGGAPIVHFSNITHLTRPLWAARLRSTGVRVVATVHDVFRQKYILSERYERAQLVSFYRTSDALLVHGENQKAQLAELGVDSAKIHQIPTGSFDFGKLPDNLSKVKREYGVPEGKVVGLSFGHIRDEKNLDLLLRAVKLYRANVHLLIAGGVGHHQRKDKAFYLSIIRELGIVDSVSWVDGPVSDEEIPRLFAAADWLALPYSRSFTSQSGVFTIAMTYGRPVLGTRTGAMEEVSRVFDVGVFVEPDDADSLAEGMKILVERIRRGDEFQFEAYRRRNSWEENARRTLDVYRSLEGA